MIWTSIDLTSDIPQKPQKNTQKIPLSFVHLNDHQVVTDFIRPSVNGPWIAGGACLAWYQNKPTNSDIDVYFKDKHQYESLRSEYGRTLYRSRTLKDYYSEPCFESENAMTYKFIRTEDLKVFKIQFIRKNFYQNLTEVINDFDMTVCKIGWDGDKVQFDRRFPLDVLNKVIRFDHLTDQSYKRMIKYMCYGYSPLPGTIDTILEKYDIEAETLVHNMFDGY